MFDIVGKRRWYFLLSLVIIVPGLIFLLVFHLRLSVDFTGGSLMEFQFEEPIQPVEVREVFVEQGLTDTVVQTTAGEHNALIRAKSMDAATKERIKLELEERFGELTELRFESVGPSLGAEVSRAALIAVAMASIAVLFFITLAFRKVPNPLRYGACAIAAMVHDVLVVTGLFSIFGVVFGWEVDALFLTALLTIIGFSVQDTIVVFDRIRENMRKRAGEPYEVIVNRSLLETLHRSLATQLNAIFVLITIFLFGGATIKQFILVLLIGLLSGTYSSIFNAVPLLVAWEQGEIGQIFRPVGRLVQRVRGD
ncbi:MAG: protein translocase subunit SecF [Anaerolineae bacterium]